MQLSSQAFRILPHQARLVAAVVGAVPFAWWVWQSASAPLFDFANYYFGGYFLAAGKFDASVYYPHVFNQMISARGIDEVFASFGPNPPSAAVIFAAFSFLEANAAKLLFAFLSALLFLISFFRLCSRQAGNHHLLTVVFALLPFIFLIPIRNNLMLGQSYLLLFFFIVEGYFLYERGKHLQASALWGLAIMLKIFPAIIFLYLLLRKDFSAALKLALACGAFLVVSIVVCGLDVWLFYATEILPRSLRGQISWAFTTQYQSLNMLAKYMFVHDAVLNPQPVASSTVLYHAFQIVVKSIVLVICGLIVVERKDFFSFGLLFYAALVVSPYGNTYSNVFLGIVLVTGSQLVTRRAFFLLTLLIFAIANVPIHLFKDLPVLLQFPRLILQLALFAFVPVLIKFRSQGRVTMLALAFIGVFLLSALTTDTAPAPGLPLPEKHGFLYDIFADGESGALGYKYWDEEGEKQFLTMLRVSKADKAVSVRDNQVFYEDTQVTFSPDNKLEAIMLNGDSLVYLSDHDRGFGFYNVRIIDLTRAENGREAQRDE